MNPATQTTRERVLESACAIFADKGYRDAKVSDICERAGANIAAVNYYFGNKEALYDAVWRHAFQEAVQAFPLQAEAGAKDVPPRERLRYAVRALIHRIFATGPAGQFARLQLREMAKPTPALEEMVREAIIPQRRILVEIVEQLLGPNRSPTIVNLCVMSVVSQCLFMSYSKPVRQRLVEAKAYREEGAEVIADHITQFSLAGIEDVRRQREEGST